MEAPGTNYQYIAFNLKDPVFSDLRVRKAIAHAIDREKIIKYLWKDQARPATGVIPSGNWCYTADVATYPYDPERARELLRETGRVWSVIHLPNIHRRNNAVAGHRISAAVEGGRHQNEYSSQ